MCKAVGVLGLLSLIMQLLLNRCSRLVSSLRVEVVAGVPQLPTAGCHCCRVDGNDSLSLSRCNRTKKMQSPPDQMVIMN